MALPFVNGANGTPTCDTSFRASVETGSPPDIKILVYFICVVCEKNGYFTLYCLPMTSPDPELLALLTLRFAPGLGPRRIEALRQHFGSASAVLAAGLSEWRRVSGLDTKSLSGLGTPGLGARAQQEWERAERAGVTLLGRGARSKRLPSGPRGTRRPAAGAVGAPPQGFARRHGAARHRHCGNA